MTISEMHSMFRTLGQQKGMQLVRAILPEEIDEFINGAIIDFCREVLLLNSSTKYPDKVSQRNNAIVPYNALRTLYSEVPSIVSSTQINQYYELNLATAGVDYLAIIGLDINYLKNGTRYACRIVEPTKVGFLLNDYCNKPTKTEPFCVINSDGISSADIHIYTDGNVPNEGFVHVINMPDKVDLNNSINCNLPDYVHQEIVERAVAKFFNAIAATSNKNKQ